MTFTDDDLKRLKEEFYEGYLIEHPKFKALLARLEASERISETVIDEHKNCGGDTCGMWKDIEAWRKAAGND